MLVIATEDELSEAVALKLFFDAHGQQIDWVLMRNRGRGHLKANIDKFCQIARRSPVIVLTDLDRARCPPSLIADWFGERVRPARLVFRVVVREVESWLLADREGLASFLGVSPAKIDANPDAIQYPKRHLLNVASFSKGALKRDILPAKGARASQGFGYNERLCEYVNEHWRVDRAAQVSGSLARARRRIQEVEVPHGAGEGSVG